MEQPLGLEKKWSDGLVQQLKLVKHIDMKSWKNEGGWKRVRENYCA